MIHSLARGNEDRFASAAHRSGVQGRPSPLGLRNDLKDERAELLKPLELARGGKNHGDSGPKLDPLRQHQSYLTGCY